MKKVGSKQKFTNARLLAIQAIYAHEITGEAYDKLTSSFVMGVIGREVLVEHKDEEEYYEPIAPADAGLFTRIMKAYETEQNQIDTAIRASLKKDVLPERLDMTLRAILRAGIAEFYANPDLDTPIIINEYTDIARSFFEGAEVNLVNAILDRFSKILRGAQDESAKSE